MKIYAWDNVIVLCWGMNIPLQINISTVNCFYGNISLKMPDDIFVFHRTIWHDNWNADSFFICSCDFPVRYKWHYFRYRYLNISLLLYHKIETSYNIALNKNWRRCQALIIDVASFSAFPLFFSTSYKNVRWNFIL